ncbi:MAG: radical SAM protein [Patescibacteria group bacterium]
MKILFVIPELLLSEPLGLMRLSADCKKYGHQTKLAVLKKDSIIQKIEEFQPVLIGYSTMTPDAPLFKEADELVQKWRRRTGRKVYRIMGGPHPTFYPEVLSELNLEAICLGEGDRAIIEIIKRIEKGENFSGIPNVMSQASKSVQLELIDNLDALPFADRDIIYEAAPYYRSAALRSFLTARGCPYNCTYCYNHLYNKMFGGCGTIMRRRSVANVIEEIKKVIREYPPVRFIRFADDTFVHQVDDWLKEFARRYKKEINLPFYCITRSNTITEEGAKILKEAGCHSIGMAVETGDEAVRNRILKRNLPNEVVIRSFAITRKYHFKTYGNTMLAIPGTTTKQDFDSFIFMKKLRLSAPTFGIFSPYPNTELTDYALQKGFLKDKFTPTKYGLKSVLNNYTEDEKDWQIRLAYLGPLFCALPDFFLPVFKFLLKLKLTKFYIWIGSIYTSYITYAKTFPGILPRQPVKLFKIVRDAVRYSRPEAEEKIRN